MVFQLAYGLETVVLRVFNVYGPRRGFGEYGDVIAQFVRRLLVWEPPVVYGDGMQTRDFVYVDDVVEAVLMSLINSDVGVGCLL
jgi:UDP-glucose 4-epimerase